jgi:hypothetical protein
MKLATILVLLLVFLTAVLLHFLFMRKEAFANAVKTQLTPANFQEAVDQFATKLISIYQEIKKEATKTNDSRMLYRYAFFRQIIKELNQQYPSLQNGIQTYNWDTIKPNAMSLEDVKTLIEFCFYKVNRSGSSSWLTPATVSDLDLLSSSTAATMRIYGDKFLLFQGGSYLKSAIEPAIRMGLEAISNLKKSFPTDKTNIPLLQNDSYFYALMSAWPNFVKDPVTENIAQSGNIMEPPMGNLPLPKSISQTVSDLLQKGTSTATPPSTATTATTSTTATTTPTGTASTSQTPGMKFSELIQALISYGGLPDKSAKPIFNTTEQSTSSTTTNTGSNLDEIRKVVRDELSSQSNTASKDSAAAAADSSKTSSDSNEPSASTTVTKKDSAASTAANVENSCKTVINEIMDKLQTVKTGPKDVANADLSSRSTEPVKPATACAKSDALAQGSWFQKASQGCPYAQGEAQAQGDAQFDPSLQPIPNPIDMNDYIRKDSIPCWSCNLK